jgi:hypothetical protein
MELNLQFYETLRFTVVRSRKTPTVWYTNEIWEREFATPNGIRTPKFKIKILHEDRYQRHYVTHRFTRRNPTYLSCDFRKKRWTLDSLCKNVIFVSLLCERNLQVLSPFTIIHFSQHSTDRGQQVSYRNSTYILYAKFEVLMMMKIQIAVFKVLTPCSDVVEYQRFGGPCCFHLHITLHNPLTARRKYVFNF